MVRRWLVCLLVAGRVAVAAPWRPVDSDLPPDPLLREGTLPNGVRYLILPNAEPRDRVALRLVVAAGSLHEADDERGLAHFVEHMAFRGTRAFPGGALSAALQRLGIAPGPDSTAFTTFDHTIYHLELPGAQESVLREGLRAFREYASAVTFDAALIEKERGVVLAEMATRDTPGARLGDFNLRFIWPEAREARRKVIGDAAQLRTFTRGQFVSFYDAWYRPERLAVIVVGPVDAAGTEALVREYFASLMARAPARSEPLDLAAPASGANVGVFSDPDLIGFTLGFQHPRPRPAGRDTRERRREALHEALAFAMFGSRMQRLAQRPESSFITPYAGSSPGLRDWQLVNFSVSGRIDDWKRVALEVEREHRRALRFGFTAPELAEAKAAFAVGYEQAARSAATRPSSALAQQLVGLILQGSAFATPAEIHREVAPLLAAATLEDCRRAFRLAWSTAAPSVFVAAHPSFAISREQIADALNESRADPVAAPEEVAPPEFAYLDFGPPGKLAREERLGDLDLRLARFANGVGLNFKSTTFEADVVEVRVRIGHGKSSQLRSLPGLDLLAEAAFTAGGVGRHTAQELRDILASRSLRLGFNVDTDAFVFAGRCAPRDLLLTLQVIAAFLTDPSFRPEVMRESRARFNSLYASLAASPGGPITLNALREVFADDPRFGLPTLEALYARHLGELTAWLEPQLKEGPLELSVVGDVAWEDALAAVAGTLGALPARAELLPHAADIPLQFSPPPPRGAQRLYPTSPTVKQVAVAWYWPAPTVTSIHEERRSHLLAQVLAERLRLRVREELGATYGISVQFVRMDGFPGGNYFAFYGELDPLRTGDTLRIVYREAGLLCQKGPDADEFERVRQPYLREMSDNLRTNIYWGGTVLSDAQQNPSRIAAARDRAADIAAITRADLAALARRHLDPDRALKFTTIPLAPPGPKAGAAPSQ